MTNTEPVVTQEDRALAREIELYISQNQWHRVKEFVAQHRIDAVAKREAEIVGAAIRFADENDKSGVYCSVYASVTLRSFARWVQTGGGA